MNAKEFISGSMLFFFFKTARPFELLFYFFKPLSRSRFWLGKKNSRSKIFNKRKKKENIKVGEEKEKILEKIFTFFGSNDQINSNRVESLLRELSVSFSKAIKLLPA